MQTCRGVRARVRLLQRWLPSVHIVGIGGIGMSAIAEVMHTRGYHVQGSDLKDGANLDRLRVAASPA